MKKMGNILVLSGMVLFGSSLAGGTFAQAAEVSTSDKSATFELTAPATNPLSITNATDLTFGTQELSTSAISADSTTDASLTITDLRGTATGWTVKAALSDFQSGSNVLTGAMFSELIL